MSIALQEQALPESTGGGGGAVDSVFGRTGVVSATSGDYTSDQVTNASGVAGASVSDALDALDTDLATAEGTIATQGTTLTTKADVNFTINTQTGTTYTLVLSDAGKLIDMSNAGAIALTIPANATVAFPVGTIITVLQAGAGQVTVGITTDTLNGRNGLKTAGQWAVITLIKRTSTTWVLSGDSTT
jgi:hypothetical protein